MFDLSLLPSWLVQIFKWALLLAIFGYTFSLIVHEIRLLIAIHRNEKEFHK